MMAMDLANWRSVFAPAGSDPDAVRAHRQRRNCVVMIVPPRVKVYLVLGYTGMRRGIDGLAMLVQDVLKKDGPSVCLPQQEDVGAEDPVMGRQRALFVSILIGSRSAWKTSTAILPASGKPASAWARPRPTASLCRTTCGVTPNRTAMSSAPSPRSFASFLNASNWSAGKASFAVSRCGDVSDIGCSRGGERR
jgi:hypothetical protein